MPATRTHPFVALATEYATKVAEGRIRVCRFAQQACARQLADLSRWRSKEDPYYFDAAAANRVCSIISKFPHIRGDWARGNRKLELEGWQCFVLSTVFGWKHSDTETRRFRVSYIEVPRKNAKSTITSALGNYLVACDDEPGAQVVSAANTREQAKIVFVDAQLMARKEPGFLKKFGVEVLAHTIVQPESASRFEALSAEHSNLDGLNLHAALIDELHAHPTRGLWDVLITATGSRAQSIIWAITTAGVNRASVCYDQRQHVRDILAGQVPDDAYFGIIYTVDEGDDYWDEATWAKANPNYNVSIYPTTFRAEAKRAQHMPSEQNNFLWRRLNVWTNADIAWLPAGTWERCADSTLDIADFAKQRCYIGVDLARRRDITAMMLVFPPDGTRDWWAVFGRYYLPEQTVNAPENGHYQGWEIAGRLIATQGVITDFDRILDDLYDCCTQYVVAEIVFDPNDASPIIGQIPKRGITRPVVDVRQSTVNMSPGMVELEGLALGRKIRHDGDPVLAWMVSNVKLRFSGDLISPIKESEDRKIDGVVGTIMCVSRAMKNDAPTAQAGVSVLSLDD